MRISTSLLFSRGLDVILNQQATVARTQLEVATGKRIQSPSEDPAAATRALGIRDALAETKQFAANIDSARSYLSIEEAVLTNTVDVLQRVRELAVRANNGTLSDDERLAIAAEVEERGKELLGLANTRGSNGEYLFSGFQSRTRPFTPNAAGDFDYHGDEGQRHLRVSSSLQIPVSDSGAEIFRDIRTGNGTFAVNASPGNTGSGVIDNGSVTNPSLWLPDTYAINFVAAGAYEVRDSGGALVTSGAYVDGGAISFNGVEARIGGAPAAGDSFVVEPSRNQDVFSTVSDFVDALNIPVTDAASEAAMNQGINNALANLDQALNNVLEVRSRIGARMNTADDEARANAGIDTQLQQAISDIENVDLAEAVSRLNRQLFALEAAQQSFATIQNLSLFRYL